MKTSEKIYTKNTPVTELVDEIQAKAEEKGYTLSRWQANRSGYATEITYAIHTGERAAQFRLQKDVAEYITLSQSEGKTMACEAYRKLMSLRNFLNQ